MVDVTNFFPKENISKTYDKYVNDRIQELDALLLGTEEYLTSLTHRGENARIPEVLENQTSEIRKFVAETYVRIEKVREFMGYLEYKEKQTVVPNIETVIQKWVDKVSGLDKILKQLSKKF